MSLMSARKSARLGSSSPAFSSSKISPACVRVHLTQRNNQMILESQGGKARGEAGHHLWYTQLRRLWGSVTEGGAKLPKGSMLNRRKDGGTWGVGQEVTRRSLRLCSIKISSISDCIHRPARQGLRCTMLEPTPSAGALSPFVRMGSFSRGSKASGRQIIRPAFEDREYRNHDT